MHHHAVRRTLNQTHEYVPRRGVAHRKVETRLERRDPAVRQLDLDRRQQRLTDLGRYRLFGLFPGFLHGRVDALVHRVAPLGWRRTRRQHHGDSRHDPMLHAFTTVRFSHLHPSLPDFSADILGSFVNLGNSRRRVSRPLRLSVTSYGWISAITAPSILSPTL